MGRQEPWPSSLSWQSIAPRHTEHLQIQVPPDVRHTCQDRQAMLSAYLQILHQIPQVLPPLQVARSVKLTVSPIDIHVEVAECQLARRPTTCSITGSLESQAPPRGPCCVPKGIMAAHLVSEQPCRAVQVRAAPGFAVPAVSDACAASAGVQHAGSVVQSFQGWQQTLDGLQRNQDWSTASVTRP